MAYPTYGSPGYNPYAQTPYPQNPVPSPAPVQVQNSAVPQLGFACRPVTSREEAAAVQVDFFGPGTVMPDLGHGVIYLKRFNGQTGSCDIFEFVAQQPKEEEPVQYATRQDIDALRDEIEKLKVRKVKKNDPDE